MRICGDRLRSHASARLPAGYVEIDHLPTIPGEIDFKSKRYTRNQRAFYMTDTPVTQQQFLRATGRNPSDPSLVQLDAPVQCVTWAEAGAFCQDLSRREGRVYRLGADYLAQESDCLSPSKLEMKYPPGAKLPTIGFRIVCESVDRN